MYADHAATSWPILFPVDEKPRGNPSSGHAIGRMAREELLQARRRILAALNLMPLKGDENIERQVVFTSGGTEADNLIVRQGHWKAIFTTSVEHHAVFMTAQHVMETSPTTVTFLPLDGLGRLEKVSAEKIITNAPNTGAVLVSLAYVNNEIGCVTDLRWVAGVVQLANRTRKPEHRIWLHTDAVQAPGHVSMDMGPEGPLAGVDFVTLSAHKFHGPTGVGALVCRDITLPLKPLILGGHQQHGMRAGTEPVGAIVAMAKAFQYATAPETLRQHTQHT